MGVMENRQLFLDFVEKLDFDTVVMNDPKQCILGKFGAAHPEMIKMTPAMEALLRERDVWFLAYPQFSAFARLTFGWEAVFGSERNDKVRSFFGINKPNKQEMLNYFRRVWNMPKPLPQSITDAVTHVTELEPAE